ncbi:CopG family transcriptional regulator [Babesia caballi]|uniref:CopG family transcriptional regulator n=1 Tax=Babesia caballi TaxID=5871 RepID=A0AAV4LW24_BABCB|nr:CopG family transcriptional regulator [Babesia caballi]
MLEKDVHLARALLQLEVRVLLELFDHPQQPRRLLRQPTRELGHAGEQVLPVQACVRGAGRAGKYVLGHRLHRRNHLGGSPGVPRTVQQSPLLRGGLGRRRSAVEHADQVVKLRLGRTSARLRHWRRSYRATGRHVHLRKRREQMRVLPQAPQRRAHQGVLTQPVVLRLRVPLQRRRDLGDALALEVAAGGEEEVEQVLHQRLERLPRHELEGHLERAPADRDVRLPERLHDDGPRAVAHGQRHVLQVVQDPERHVLDVVVARRNELLHDALAQLVELGVAHLAVDGAHALVQERVRGVVGQGRALDDLVDDVVQLLVPRHLVAALGVDAPDERQHLDLQKGIVDPVDIVVPAAPEHDADAARGRAAEAVHRLDEQLVDGGEVAALGEVVHQHREQRQPRRHHAVVAVAQHRRYQVHVVRRHLHGVRPRDEARLPQHAQHPRRAHHRLLAQVHHRRLHQALQVVLQLAEHLLAADVGQHAERRLRRAYVVAVEVHLDGVDGEREHLGVLVEQQAQREVAHALVRVLARGDQLDALHLAEVRRVAHELYEQEFGDVLAAVGGGVAVERAADFRALARDDRPLLAGRLAAPDGAYHVLD